MPRISRFYGITIAMYYLDHNPPHLHAIFGEDEATLLIESGALLAGSLPPRVHSLVQEWMELHRDELRRNWDRARLRQALQPVAPLA